MGDVEGADLRIRAIGELGKPPTERVATLGGAALDFLGLLLEQRGAGAEAEAMFRRAVAADPGDPQPRNHLSLLLWRARREAEAQREVEATLAIAPASADTVNNLGLLAETACDIEAATRCYERAVALDLRHAEAQFNLGCMRLAAGRFAEGWEGYGGGCERLARKRRSSARSPGTAARSRARPSSSIRSRGSAIRCSSAATSPWWRPGAATSVQPPLTGSSASCRV
jgi:tetratricopeptide (TPR) repeat protein